jgi:hypothetical protein
LYVSTRSHAVGLCVVLAGTCYAPCIHTQTYAQRQKQAQSYTDKPTHARTHAHTHTHTHTHTHSHTFTHTHTHTHIVGSGFSQKLTEVRNSRMQIDRSVRVRVCVCVCVYMYVGLYDFLKNLMGKFRENDIYSGKCICMCVCVCVCVFVYDLLAPTFMNTSHRITALIHKHLTGKRAGRKLPTKSPLYYPKRKVLLFPVLRVVLTM